MKETIFDLMNDDPVVAEEYSASLRRVEHLEPEKTLLLAVLDDAIHSFKKYCSAKDRVGKERFQEAEHWIMQPGNDWLFSFENVCELLGLDPQYLRCGLFEWKQKIVQQRKSTSREAQGNHAA